MCPIVYTVKPQTLEVVASWVIGSLQEGFLNIELLLDEEDGRLYVGEENLEPVVSALVLEEDLHQYPVV